MSSENIICSGGELEGVLAGIRERGCTVTSLETCVGGVNGNYRVSYFERGESEKGLIVTGPAREARITYADS